MVIDEKKLLEERAELEKDFNNTQENIKRVETEVGSMKSNLNALYGAIQQVDKMLSMVRNDKKEEAPKTVKEKK
jgi:phage shock protein A|tara:strand:- start:1528 stop:1749 length:222 start_codon:yes stop_codon:yes gene_type:complete